MAKTFDEVLDSMELFRKHEERMASRGVCSANLRKVADPDEKAVFFRKKTDKVYGGSCEHYGGYWLDGVHGAVVCDLMDCLLPGIIRDLYCGKNCGECPLHGGEREEKREIDL